MRKFEKFVVFWVLLIVVFLAFSFVPGLFFLATLAKNYIIGLAVLMLFSLVSGDLLGIDFYR